LARLDVVFRVGHVAFDFFAFLLNFIIDYELFEVVVLGSSERDESVSFVSITAASAL
jgi:hypothetical protein